MYIAIGKLARPHGTKGHIKVLPYSGIPERFLGLKMLFVETETGLERFLVESVEEQGEIALIKFKAVDSRGDAVKLSGCEVLLPADQKIDLPDDVFFIHDVVGLKVFDKEGNPLGMLEAVMQSAGPDVYVVRDGEREALIPAVSEFVQEIDIPGGRMVVSLIEGMFSDED
ncbi:MAG: 16S rRNA processing protein RimM [Calditrichaeota bacterium]|nr:16S rRNA processing protein RimM [Calditrichota bacterium]